MYSMGKVHLCSFSINFANAQKCICCLNNDAGLPENKNYLSCNMCVLIVRVLAMDHDDLCKRLKHLYRVIYLV